MPATSKCNYLAAAGGTKAVWMFPPVLALLVVAGWIVFQRHSIIVGDAENSRLVELRAAATNDEPFPSDSHPAASPGRSETLFWKQLARQTDGDSMRSQSKISQLVPKLKELSEQELVAGLDQLPSLEMSETARTYLELVLGSLLSLKNPELALNRFGSHASDDNAQYAALIRSAFRLLADTDAARAAAWLDGEIAAGRFDCKASDGKNSLRDGCEAVLVGELLSLDPTAATKRLEKLPEQQRSAVLQQSLRERPTTELERDAFVKAVCTLLPATDQGGTLTVLTLPTLRDGGLASVSRLLDRYRLPDDVRATAAELTLYYGIRFLLPQKVTAAEVADLSGWIRKESIKNSDAAVGTWLSLACENRLNTFDESTALVLEYQRKAGNDLALVSFLNSNAAARHKDRALPLVESIADKNLQAEIRKKLE